MATKIYGSCTGPSAGKYYYYLEITENSQSISGNTSNVTVKMKLKRNDGYKASAYNLNENSNSVILYVNSVKRVQSNLQIDTRNNQVVTLASWTGNVTHGTNGTLSLPVSGSFVIDTNGLTGGSVSGNYNCTDIPRASTLSVSSGSVNPGEAFGCTITAADNSFNHKLKYSIGQYSSTVSLTAGTLTNSFSVPVSWANAVKESRTGTISVTLYTYNGSTKIGTKSYSKSFVVPNTDSYRPDFNISVTPTNPTAIADWNVLVQNISAISVNISDASYKYGATLSSKAVSFCGVKKASLPAAFDVTESGSVTVSVTVTDSRGLSKTKSVTLSVYEYSAPSIELTELKRCTADGTGNNSGTYFSASFNTAFSSIGNHNSSLVRLRYKTSSGLWSPYITVSSSPAVFGDGNILPSETYTVEMTHSDLVADKESSSSRTIGSSYIPFNIRPGGNGAAFGCYAENENELAVAYNLNVKGVITYTDATALAVINSEAVSVCDSDIRYFPCLGMVFAKFRAVLSVNVSAESTVKLLTIPGYSSFIGTPLAVSTDISAGRALEGYVNNSAEIKIRTKEAIPSGTKLYVAGFWIPCAETGVQ